MKEGSPQKENGYTAIANEILEHLSFAGLNGSEYRIVFVVLRKTYGFQKKADRISLTQFEAFAQMKRSHVASTIASLVHKRVLLKEKGLYSFNKYWKQWVVHKRVPQSTNVVTGSPQKQYKGSPQKGTHKRKKETITKERGKSPQPPAPEIEKKFMFGEFKNVSLSLTEKEKLKEVYGRGKALEMVETLSAHLTSIGKDKYASHYATIRNWARRDKVPELEKPKPKKVEKEVELTEEEKARNAEMRRKISESIKNRFKKT